MTVRISRSALKWSSIAMSPANLTLANTLPVGQSFLWHRHQDEAGPSFSRAISDPPRVVFLRQDSTHLHYAAVQPSGLLEESTETLAWINDYFQLEGYPSLPDLYSSWRKLDPELFGKTELDPRTVGIRVLRQDPWECLVAFITSTNNHIPRITSLLHRLSETYSKPIITIDDITYYPFPSPDDLPPVLDARLRELGFGYRAPFLESTLATLHELYPGGIAAGLESLRRKPLDQVRETLISLKGVGRKVADCVMLMCLDRPELIPVDTHVAAIAARHPAFPSRLRGKPMSQPIYEAVQQFLADRWGEMGGWCQAVMFAADLKPSLADPTARASPAKKRKSVKVEVLEAVEVKLEMPVLKRTRSESRAFTESKLQSLTLEVKEEIKDEVKGEA